MKEMAEKMRQDFLNLECRDDSEIVYPYEFLILLTTDLIILRSEINLMVGPIGNE